MSDKPTCKSCKWSRPDHRSADIHLVWVSRDDGTQTQVAIRRIPCVIRSPSHGFFPLVYTDDFCGEHTPKEEGR